MISSEHAAKRVAQVAGICLRIFREHEEEAEQDAAEAREVGLDAEARQVGIPTSGDTVYTVWHKYLEFYSQHL